MQVAVIVPSFGDNSIRKVNFLCAGRFSGFQTEDRAFHRLRLPSLKTVLDKW